MALRLRPANGHLPKSGDETHPWRVRRWAPSETRPCARLVKVLDRGTSGVDDHGVASRPTDRQWCLADDVVMSHDGNLISRALVGGGCSGESAGEIVAFSEQPDALVADADQKMAVSCSHECDAGVLGELATVEYGEGVASLALCVA